MRECECVSGCVYVCVCEGVSGCFSVCVCEGVYVFVCVSV